jgi:hypothetical protein
MEITRLEKPTVNIREADGLQGEKLEFSGCGGDRTFGGEA